MYQVSELQSRHTEREHRQGAFSWYHWKTLKIVRRKAEALEMVASHPTRCAAVIAHTSDKIADNGKPFLHVPGLK